MGLRVIRQGVQATLQAAPRDGQRHLAIPASGPADPLSMALANRLVGNPAFACALEIALGMMAFEATTDCVLAIAGADVEVACGGRPVRAHQTFRMRAGETLTLGSPATGARIYLAIHSGFAGDPFLGSESTCLPAGFGGYQGRALKAGDVLETQQVASSFPDTLETPENMRPVFTHSFALRSVPGPDANTVTIPSAVIVFTATRRADRTGIELSGGWTRMDGAAQKPSAPLFPGAVQLTPSGNAFVLLPDCQTTGGYPHILQVSRADRHMLGQVRPGDTIRFLQRTEDEAADDLRQKTQWFRDCLPDLCL